MLGFTKKEERIVAVLIGAFVVGSAIRMYQHRFAPLPQPEVKTQWASVSDTESNHAPRGTDLMGRGNQGTDEKIALNSATYEELISISGIGPVLADRIIQYREGHDGFTSVDELKKVKGIGNKKFEQLKTAFIIH